MKTKINVTNMNCKHCVKIIKEELTKNQVKSKIILSKKTVVVTDKDYDLAKTIILSCGYQITN